MHVTNVDTYATYATNDIYVTYATNQISVRNHLASIPESYLLECFKVIK